MLKDSPLVTEQLVTFMDYQRGRPYHQLRPHPRLLHARHHPLEARRVYLALHLQVSFLHLLHILKMLPWDLVQNLVYTYLTFVVLLEMVFVQFLECFLHHRDVLVGLTQLSRLQDDQYNSVCHCLNLQVEQFGNLQELLMVAHIRRQFLLPRLHPYLAEPYHNNSKCK